MFFQYCFSSMGYAFGVEPETSLPNLGPRNFLLCLLLALYQFRLTCGSVTYSHLIFCILYKVWTEILFFFAFEIFCLWIDRYPCISITISWQVSSLLNYWLLLKSVIHIYVWVSNHQWCWTSVDLLFVRHISSWWRINQTFAHYLLGLFIHSSKHSSVSLFCWSNFMFISHYRNCCSFIITLERKSW